MIRFLVTAAVILAIAYAVLALYANHVKRSGMFFPDRYPLGDWTPKLSVKPQDYFFTTADGVRLHAWFFRAPSADAPLIIYFHGNAGHLAYRAPFASELASRGLSVFVFDYRGFGRSDGSPSEKALHLDSLAAYDFARQTFRVPPDRIVLYGESIGAPYAARVAMQRPVCCIIVEGTFPSLRRIANAVFRPIPMGFFAGELLLTTRWLNAAVRPVLVMHGKRDAVVPFDLGVELYQELKVQKELFVSETAGHGELEWVEGDRFYEAVIRFVGRHAPPGP